MDNAARKLEPFSMPQLQLVEASVKQNSRAVVFLGIVQMICGILCLCLPFLTGIAVTAAIGIFLLAAGILEFGTVIRAGSFSEGIWAIIGGALLALCGFAILLHPAPALLSLTALITAYLFVAGIVEIVRAIRIRPINGWGWLAFDGAVSLLLSACIYGNWPVAGFLALGVFVGIHLLVRGTAFLAIGGAIESAFTRP